MGTARTNGGSRQARRGTGKLKALALALAFLSPMLSAPGARAEQDGSDDGNGRTVLVERAVVDAPDAATGRDVDAKRPGKQLAVSVRIDRAARRIVVQDAEKPGGLVATAADDASLATGALVSGWRLVVVGGRAGSGRLWPLTFATSGAATLAPIDVALPCDPDPKAARVAGGSFTLDVPAGASPSKLDGPRTISVTVNRGRERSVAFTASSGEVIANSDDDIVASGAFGRNGLGFVYGTSDRRARLWTPRLQASSKALDQTDFVACSAGPVPFNGTVNVTVNTAAATSATIGAEGGSLQAGGMTLTIPRGALAAPTLITARPVTAVGGSPLGSLVGALDLQPQGLQFLVPATLTVPLPAGSAPGSVVAFGYEGTGSQFVLQTSSVSGAVLQIPISHFSGAGAAQATAAQIQAAFAALPSAAEKAAEMVFTAAIQVVLAVGGNPSTDVTVRQALLAWGSIVESRMTLAKGASWQEFRGAVGAVAKWEGIVRVSVLDQDPQFAIPLAGMHARMEEAAIELVDRELAGCTGAPPLLPTITEIDGVIADLTLLGIDPTGRSGSSGRALPAPTATARACVHVNVRGLTVPNPLGENVPNTASIDVVTSSWNGPDRTDNPLDVRVLQERPTTSDVLLNTVTGIAGPITMDIKPLATVGSTRLRVEADFTVAVTSHFLENLNDAKTFLKPIQAATIIEGKGPGDAAFTISPATVPPQSSVAVQVRVAGNHIAGRPITLSLNGPGSLSSSSATTDATGTASVSYTSPTGRTGPALVTASWTDGATTDSAILSIPLDSGITVSVTPATTSVGKGGSVPFSATVNGAGSNTTDVTWSVSGGGTIDAAGTFTAGTTQGTFTVTATSVADPSKKGTATVTVKQGDLYTGTIHIVHDTFFPSGTSHLDATLDLTIRYSNGVFTVVNVGGSYLLGYSGGCTGAIVGTFENPGSIVLGVEFAPAFDVKPFVSELAHEDCGSGPTDTTITHVPSGRIYPMTPVFSNGQLVEIDGTWNDSYRCCGGGEDYSQTGKLRPA